MGIAELAVPKKDAHHVQCWQSISLVDRAVEDLGALVARVKGQSRKEEVNAPQPEARLSLSDVLREAPGHLARASTQITDYLIELGDLLF